MGLLTKIIDRGDAVVVAPQVPLSQTAMAAPAPTAPAACPTCRGVAFWQDVYANHPHCRVCRPAPIASMVKRNVWLLPGDDGGPLEWFERGADGELTALAEILADEAAAGSKFGDVRSATIERPSRNWTVLAANSRGIDLLRLHGSDGRYSPPRGFGPVGDMIFDEWWATLPDGLPGWPKAVKS